jgi:hypothetical protein
MKKKGLGARSLSPGIKASADPIREGFTRLLRNGKSSRGVDESRAAGGKTRGLRGSAR